MKKFYIGFFFLFSISALVYPQINSIASITDFKISTDNSPSTIIQNNPKLYCNGTKGFLIVWEDQRWSDAGYAAQYFDSLGNPVGKNFKMFSNEGITFSRNNSFTAIEQKWYDSYYLGPYVNYTEKTYNFNGDAENTFHLISAPGGCDVCCTGIDYQFIPRPDSYLFFFRNEGYVTFIKYDLDGKELSYSLPDEKKYPTRAGSLSVSVNDKANYLLAYFNFSEYDYYNDSIYLGIYCNVYDKYDSLIVKNKLIQQFQSSEYAECHYTESNTPIVKSTCFSDSLFEIFWIDKDSSSLSFLTIDDKGNILTDKTLLALPFTETFNGYYEFLDLNLSNQTKDGFGIEVSIKTQKQYEHNYHYYNYLFYFDSEGKFIRQVMDSSSYFNFSEQFFKISDSTFFIATEKDDDIFLSRMNSFTTIESKKINDDDIGSNDINPRLVKSYNQTNFITWENELNSIGQKIDLNGNLIGNPVVLKGSKAIFNNDEDCFNIWKKDISPDSSQLGYSVYNSDWELVKEEIEPLTRDYYSINADITKFNDSIFIQFVYDWYWPSNNITIRTLNNNFEKVREIKFSGNNFSSVKFFKENENSFWISFPNELQLYSTQLEPLSSIHNLYVHQYFGDSTFLFTFNDCPYYDVTCNEKYGTIFKINGDTLVKKFRIASKALEFKVVFLPNNDFLAIWNNDNNIYARAFSKEGVAKTDSFLIHSNIQSFKKQPTVLVNGDIVFFTWSDARNEGRGYDIYGSIFDLSKVVSVEEEDEVNTPTQFSLSQNYPNPFNPTTKIKYSIPFVEVGHAPSLHVTLKVYDILGSEVAILVNEEKPAGEYEVEFDGSKLASGIYFYQLKAGNFVETKKFILMK